MPTHLWWKGANSPKTRRLCNSETSWKQQLFTEDNVIMVWTLLTRDNGIPVASRKFKLLEFLKPSAIVIFSMTLNNRMLAVKIRLLVPSGELRVCPDQIKIIILHLYFSFFTVSHHDAMGAPAQSFSLLQRIFLTVGQDHKTKGAECTWDENRLKFIRNWHAGAQVKFTGNAGQMNSRTVPETQN